MTIYSTDFILASGSPRRRELLCQIGAAFTVAAVDIAEHRLPGEAPNDYVTRLALAKAKAGQQLNSESPLPVMGADTAVVLGNDIFGKPQGREQAVEMLMRLSGRCHRVLSGVALVNKQRQAVVCVETLVHFRTLNIEQCEQYWHSGEAADKAGSYAIQGYAAVFVDRIEGSYSNVVGLPLAETGDLLAEFGIEIWKGV